MSSPQQEEEDHVPFPYPPYPLQSHAMNAIRAFLDYKGTPQPHGEVNVDEGSHPSARTAVRLAVLESPTGTGKSQILLNSVLSHFYDPVYPPLSTGSVHGCATSSTAEGATREELMAAGTKRARSEEDSSRDEGNPVTSSSSQSPQHAETLEQLLQRQRLEEEVQRLKVERKERVKMERRRLRRLRRQQQALTALRAKEAQLTKALATLGQTSAANAISHTRHGTEAKEKKEEEEAVVSSLILDQNPLELLEEQRQLLRAASATSSLPHLSSDSSGSSRSSSTMSTSSRRSSSDDDDDVNVAEVDLATSIPLRRPKVYMASRTHTQLAQLQESLRLTAYAQHPVHLRTSPSSSSTGPSISSYAATSPTASRNAADTQRSTPRWLRTVHVASRQQLCINAALRQRAGGGGADVLNELCREAMQWEYSPAGRAARRAEERRTAQGTMSAALSGAFAASAAANQSSSSSSFSSFPLRGGGHGDRVSDKNVQQQPTKARGVADIEDSLGDDATRDTAARRGCEYCAKHRLHALLRYVQQRQQSETPTTTTTTTASSPGICTLEDMQRLGRELRACPFLATRLLLRGADVVFIPYGYLVDEAQRDVLLSGPATNPATDEEEEEVERSARCVGSASPSAMGSVLSRRVGRHQRARFGPQSAVHARQPMGGVVKASPSHARTRTASECAEVQGRPPHLTGDVVVIDEAHNIADHCRSVSTVSVSNAELRVMRRLLELYLARFESRLLTRNKQKLRELILWLGQLLRCIEEECRWPAPLSAAGEEEEGDEASDGAIGTAAPRKAAPIKRQAAAANTVAFGVGGDYCRTVVFSFTSLLFAAGVDHVDVYPLLVFLAESRLLVKLEGLAALTLRSEAVPMTQPPPLTPLCVSAVGKVDGRKRRRKIDGPTCATDGEVGEDDDDDGGDATRTMVQARAVQQQERISSTAAAAAPSFSALCGALLSPFQSTAAPSAAAAAAAAVSPSNSPRTATQKGRYTNHSGGPGEGSSAESRLVAMYLPLITRALQHVEGFLRWVDASDRTTRVIFTVKATPVSATPTSAPLDDTPVGTSASSTTATAVQLKLVQLEPGRHTLYPVLREVSATVLAGGTMQPLALTCAPLLPPSTHRLPETSPSDALLSSTASKSSSTVVRASARTVRTADEDSKLVGQERLVGTVREVCAGVAGEAVTLISEPHVVPPSSIAVWALATGPSGRRLEFSQHAMQRDRMPCTVTGGGGGGVSGGTPSAGSLSAYPAVFTELASTLLNFVRVLPPAGVVCFFTSYDVEARFSRYLRESGYYAQINEVKRIFHEGGGGVEDGEAEEDEEESVHTERRRKGGVSSSPSSSPSTSRTAPLHKRTSEEVEAMLRAYKSWIYEESDATGESNALHSPTRPSPRRGALLFAVMGGRLSEGINFADDLGRAVLVVGLPYANPNDAELNLYLHHVATTRVLRSASTSAASLSTKPATTCVVHGSALGHGHHSTSALSPPQAVPTSSHSPSSSPSVTAASAAEWSLYTDLCMRTVNQCIGRCIRHAKDYAVVVLLDARYADRQEVRQRVSHWMQPSLRVAHQFGEAFRGVRQFFAERESTS